LKNILFLLLIFSGSLFAQTEYVLSNNKVYDFLERMESLQIIHKYNSLEIPKSRSEIAGYLEEVIANKEKLDKADKNLLTDLEVEFELEIYGTLKHSQRLIGGDRFNFFSQGEKYLYFVSDTSRNVNLFFNSSGRTDGIMGHYFEHSREVSAAVLSFEFQIRGSFYNKFGFFYRGGNGVVAGNREAALFRDDLKYNYKYNTFDKPNSFDITTAGYLTADFGLIKLKFGRDRKTIGFGPVKALVGNNSEIFDNLSFTAKYKSVEVSYFHGKLLGNSTETGDTVHGNQNLITEKYVGYHRIGFNLSDDFNIGASEMIIYGDRGLDFNYLNPFNLYKTAQNSNKDRDNSMIIFDFNNKSIKGLKFYGLFLIDDIEMAKVGSNYWGNQFIYNVGFVSNNLYKTIPLEFQFEYIRIDPFVYTHRLSRNSYTNNERSIASFMQPNSELFLTQFNYRLTGRVNLTATLRYYIHGANPLNPDGSVLRNVGGDILLGHREFDAKDAPFLDGDKEITRAFAVKLIYEPVKDYFFTGMIKYKNESLQNSNNNKWLEAYLMFDYQL